MTLELALQFAQQNRIRHREALEDFLRIPSVSTLPENKPDMQAAAEWLAASLQSSGHSNVSIIPTGGPPVVYGELMQAGDQAPTVLVYGHYDVQPPDPLEEWHSPPFDPQVREDHIFARGVADMKGQIVQWLAAVESMVRTSSLPVNLKYLFEGEEEVGSPNLAAFIEANKDRFQSDLCLNCDAGILDAETPSITYALRGLAYFEIRLHGPSSDLHSGTYGGAVDNPANVLSQLIAGMRDETGRIALPGFYDQVRPLAEEERRDLAALPADEKWWQEMSGAPALFGEEGYTSTERATSRPTLDVNGLLSGFTGKGSKTVLPATAMAKISMRLVPDQTPEHVRRSLTAYLEKNAPATVRWELEEMAGAIPSILERDSDAVAAASAAMQAGWKKKPHFKREGGTIPVVALIEEILGAKSLLLGFALSDAMIHAPNERLHLPTFFKGIETYIRFTHELVGSR